MAQFEHINLEALVVNQYGDIKVVDDYNLTYGRPSPLFGDVDPYSDGGIQIFRAFCAEKGVTYYAAPREEFFELTKRPRLKATLTSLWRTCHKHVFQSLLSNIGCLFHLFVLVERWLLDCGASSIVYGGVLYPI
jgi:hypothetical protein